MEDLDYEEWEAIDEALDQIILDGFPEGDDDPIVTASEKVKIILQMKQ